MMRALELALSVPRPFEDPSQISRDSSLDQAIRCVFAAIQSRNKATFPAHALFPPALNHPSKPASNGFSDDALCWHAGPASLTQEHRSLTFENDCDVCPAHRSKTASPRVQMERSISISDSPVDSAHMQMDGQKRYWAERLCTTNFFDLCPMHCSHRHRRCECTFFCLDCSNTGALCSICHRDHARCRTLQIRRYVYRDVVKVEDVKPYFDPSGVQTYTVNHAQAIFLTAKDKSLVGRPYYRVDSSSACLTCNRGLREGCKFCSLQCKLAAVEGVSFLCPQQAGSAFDNSSTRQEASWSPAGPTKTALRTSRTRPRQMVSSRSRGSECAITNDGGTPPVPKPMALFKPSATVIRAAESTGVPISTPRRAASAKRQLNDVDMSPMSSISALSPRTRRKQHCPRRSSE